MAIDRLRRGQALVELALGLFALALVASALALFAVYIAKSLKAQNHLRVGDSSVSESIPADEFARANFTGVGTLRIREKAVMPPRTILRR